MANNLRVVIAAAGSGKRMGSKINKQYMLLKGKPILAYSLDIFEAFGLVDDIVIVAHPREIEYCEKEVVEKFGYTKVRRGIPGGEQRQDSVWAGLKELDHTTCFVAVHDGARPLLTGGLISELLKEAEEWGAAIPGVRARDTLKMVDRDNFVGQTLDRTGVVAVQTPQIFNYKELTRAYEFAYEEDFVATDDAALFEKYIGRVKVVPGNHDNLKITTPEDIIIAESILKDKVSVLSGQSGVGKSSLLNRIDADLELNTQEISKALGRGKHTTRHNQLYRIADGWIADTPGFSSLSFANLDLIDFSQRIPDFVPYEGQCKYRDCLHIHEPGCTIKQKVEEKAISLKRYQHYVDCVSLIREGSR